MRIIDRVLLKFILAGIINTIVGSGLMFALYNIFGMGYWGSSAVSYIVGSIVSFFLNKYWTFNVRDWSLRMVIAFAVNIAVSYFLAYRLAKTAMYYVLAGQPQKMRDNAALLAGICVFTGLNYIGQRFIVFRARDNKKNDGDEEEAG